MILFITHTNKQNLQAYDYAKQNNLIKVCLYIEKINKKMYCPNQVLIPNMIYLSKQMSPMGLM